ncbi:MAG: transcription antitermination factor NusB [Desulfobacterales bacterium]|jgi:N utilization substance protein B|nr:transcription antitermination factor NusB [Desulfobacterales bacterium]
MGTRRKARELAMQALFYMDTRRDFSEETFGRFCANFAPKPDVRPFFLRLVRGVLRSQTELDPLIERFSENWSLGRMSGVDRNVMRIAVYEMVCCRDIPAKVSINEAVDIGKKFGTEESGAFINGIVDSIRAAVEAGELQLPCGDPEAPPEAFEGEDGPDPAKVAASAPEDRMKEQPAPAPGRPRARKTAAKSLKLVVKRKKKEKPPSEE